MKYYNPHILFWLQAVLIQAFAITGANLLVDSTGLHLRIGDFGAAATMQSIDNTLDGEFQGRKLHRKKFLINSSLMIQNCSNKSSHSNLIS